MQIIDFDSDEERYASWYFDELKTAGVLTEWQYHPKSFSLSEKVTRVFDNIIVLKTKTRIESKESTIINPHNYKADFLLKWNKQFRGKIYADFNDNIRLSSVLFVSNKDKDFTVIDIKGSFSGPHNNSAVTFPLNQKWVFQQYGIYVQKIVPKQLFAESFTPVKFLLTKASGKARKIGFDVVSVSKFIQKISE